MFQVIIINVLIGIHFYKNIRNKNSLNQIILTYYIMFNLCNNKLFTPSHKITMTNIRELYYL